MADIPHCDELFHRFFDRWYENDDRKRKAFTATRPDLLSNKAFVGVSQADASPLTEKSQHEVLRRIEIMIDAARGEWPRYLSVSGDLNLSWIDAYDRHFDTDRIAEVIARSNPEDFSNDYLIHCCEFGAVLGHVMRTLQPRRIWHLEWAYWESALLDPQTGNFIPVFHWAIKKMSSYGWDDGFAEKVEAGLQFLEENKPA